MNSKIIVYTDGSGINHKNRPDSGHGGCGYIIKWYNAKTDRISNNQKSFGRFENTTSARMEIFPVIKVLEDISFGFDIVIHTDNQYVRNTISRKWYQRWIEFNQNKANMDLWIRFNKIYNEHINHGSIINLVWVKGHADGKYPLNELADKLAYKGRKNKTVIKDDRNGIYTI